MTAVSGWYGSVKIGSSCVAEADRWSLNKTAILHDYATCASPGNQGTAVLAGRKRHSGSCSGIYDTADPIENYLNEGASVTLDLYVSATAYYTMTAVIEEMTIPDVDITEGAPIRWECSFRVNGLATYVDS